MPILPTGLKATPASHFAIPQSHFVYPLLRRAEVLVVTGISRATLYRLIKAGTFPRSVDLTEGAVGWRQSDVKKWIEDRPTSKTVVVQP